MPRLLAQPGAPLHHVGVRPVATYPTTAPSVGSCVAQRRQQRQRARSGLLVCSTNSAATSTSSQATLEAGELQAATAGGTDASTAAATGEASSSSSSSSGLSPEESQEARALADKVLEAIKDTDRGLSMSPEQQRSVDDMLDRLEALGARQAPRPLSSPLLWGNYVVAYTSSRRSVERGQAAGGRFRGRIGRSLFQTAGLYQSVLQPDVATNKVEFRLFGALPGYVALRGKVLPKEGDEAGATVRVLFEPSQLSFFDKLHLRIGPPSSVELTTTYLDERVRLGKGSRGSLFVFTRGGDADSAGMDRVGLERTSFQAALAFSAFFVSLLLGGALLWVAGKGQPLLKLGAVAFWMLGAAIAGIVRQGGIILDRKDTRVAEAQAALEKQQQQQQQQQQASSGNSSAAGDAAPAAA